MKQTFIINGKEYASLDDMPADVRRELDEAMQLLPDNDGDGQPDILQNMPFNVNVQASSEIIFNGKTYQSVEEMPADARRVYEEALSATGMAPFHLLNRKTDAPDPGLRPPAPPPGSARESQFPRPIPGSERTTPVTGIIIAILVLIILVLLVILMAQR